MSSSKDWWGVASSADGGKLVAVVNNGGIYTSQSTPTPFLNIAPLGNNVALSWIIPSLDFGLQENSDLTSTNWTDVPVAQEITNYQYQATVSPTNASSFYRLKH